MSSKPQTIKVLVADDHPVVRRGLQACLSKEDRLKVVGEATTGEEAVDRALKLRPDVVLMDISMPGMSGLDATRLLREQAPLIKILVLSVHSNRDYIFRIIQAGAHGYVSKEAATEELLRAIDAVHQGTAFFSPEMAQAALNQLVSNGGKKDPFAMRISSARERPEEPCLGWPVYSNGRIPSISCFLFFGGGSDGL